MNDINKYYNDLDNFTSIEDKYDSLYTIIVYNIQVTELIKYLFEYLKKINHIGNTFKRRYLNDRIYSFIEYIKTNYTNDDTVNNIYFISSTINCLVLMEKSVKLLKKYNIDNIYILCGNTFDIQFIKEFLFDDTITHLIEEQKNGKYIHYNINFTKGRIIFKEFNLSNINIYDYICDIKNKFIFCANNINNLKKINSDKYIFVNKLPNNEKVFELLEQDMLHHNNSKLDIIFGYIDNPKLVDKLLFGSDLTRAIKNYQVKQIFCTHKMMDKLKKVYDIKYLNFEICIVKSFNDGDNPYLLDKNYKGIIGVKYY
jgi:hypothetical protein